MPVAVKPEASEGDVVVLYVDTRISIDTRGSTYDYAYGSVGCRYNPKIANINKERIRL